MEVVPNLICGVGEDKVDCFECGQEVLSRLAYKQHLDTPPNPVRRPLGAGIKQEIPRRRQ